MDQNKLWNIIKEMGIKHHLSALPRNLYAGQEAKLEMDMEQQTDSKLGKECVKAVCSHPAFLTYMQSTSHEMLGWMTQKLESRLLGEISITSDMQIYFNGRKLEEVNSLLMKVKELTETGGFQLSIQKQ